MEDQKSSKGKIDHLLPCYSKKKPIPYSLEFVHSRMIYLLLDHLYQFLCYILGQGLIVVHAFGFPSSSNIRNPIESIKRSGNVAFKFHSIHSFTNHGRVLIVVIIFGLAFSVFFANAVIICDLSLVISVLEDVSGSEALLRSTVLIRGQTQVGLMIYLGSTIGMAFIEGLFEHRVKTSSYGNGSSRIWEGPLLVAMYSFVVLIDFMMSTVFYL